MKVEASTRRFINSVGSVGCTIVLIILCNNHVRTFHDEPTGTSTQSKDVHQMPFPAVTVCDQHFQLRKAWNELGFPLSPFGTQPKEVSGDPMMFYDRMTIFGIEFMPTLWDYYFTLEKMISPVLIVERQTCVIGGKSCSPPTNSPTIKPTDDYDGPVQTEVEAGTWTSRFLADSEAGRNYLCHTLVPNVSVDFTVPFGNAIAIKWDNDYNNLSTSWVVVMHDPHEQALLQSHAIETLPAITVEKVKDNKVSNEDHHRHERRVKILPRLQELPEPSNVLPCENSNDYSLNLCNMKWGWRKRFEHIQARHKDKFWCQLPGIVIDEELRKPVCSLALGNETHFGIDDLGESVHTEQKLIDLRNQDWKLTAPPIGIYKINSTCIPRCASYKYQLVEEPISDFDLIVGKNFYHFYAYFPSTTVEYWRVYRLISRESFLSNIGGSVGLMMGMSCFSIIILMHDLAWRVFHFIKEYISEKTVISTKRRRNRKR